MTEVDLVETVVRPPMRTFDPFVAAGGRQLGVGRLHFRVTSFGRGCLGRAARAVECLKLAGSRQEHGENSRGSPV
jgi:hypothetical protein